MRFGLCVFLLFMFCCPVWADGFTNEFTDFNTAEATQVMNDVMGAVAGIGDDFDAVLEKVRRINPEYAFQIQQIADTDATKNEAINMLYGWLMDYIYDKYKNIFLDQLNSRGQETGRQVKEESYDFGGDGKSYVKHHRHHYWLDRGVLDNKKCKDKHDFLICEYPDGFEDFFAVEDTGVLNGLDGKSFTVWKDVPSENYVLTCGFDKQKHSINGEEISEFNIRSLSYEDNVLMVDCQTEIYNERHAHRNKEVQDTKNGKYKCESDGSCSYVFQEGDEIKYPSVMHPDAVVQSFSTDFTLQENIVKSSGSKSIDQDTLHALWMIEFQELEKQMKEIAPKVVVSVADKNDVERERVYKNWLAEQAAKDAVAQAIQDMYKTSRETGRAIKTYDINGSIIVVNKINDDGGIYWLDRGFLDEPKCRIGDTGFYKCTYPKNYQEKQLIFEVSDFGISINMDEDIMQDGQLQHVITVVDFDNSNNDAYFDSHKIIYSDYDDYYRMQSEENEVALKNNALKKLSKRNLRKIQQECSRETSVKSDLCKEWSDVEMALGVVDGAVFTVEGI
ncbi:MAG: hypothetical protein IKB05_02850 [Alphaproteobacteria bacterium]|nr:hypothetical protein [Alphaproteobacteria bacterium]